jgi:hypothetical protein
LTVTINAGLVHATLKVAVGEAKSVETATRLGVETGGDSKGKNCLPHQAVNNKITASRMIQITRLDFLGFLCPLRAGTVELPRKLDGNARSISAR